MTTGELVQRTKLPLQPAQAAELEKPLSRSDVKTRTQAGRQLSYVESWHAEAEANRVFGFDGWDSTVTQLTRVAEYERTVGQGKGWGVSYICRVLVRAGGVEREGVGAGHGIDRDLGLAHESAVKEAASDAEKRALKTFGNIFGLALYDKTQENVADEEPPASNPKASNGARPPARKTDGVTRAKPQMSLSQRADLFETALKSCKTRTDLRKVYESAHVLRDLMDKGDPERLAEINSLYEVLFGDLPD